MAATMTVKKVRKVGSVTLFEWSCTCARCHHRWKAVAAEAPTRCASCTARNFSAPARPYKPRKRSPRRPPKP